MTFLNMVMLAGLGLIAIPILIHLLNRRQPKRLDWAAMRFLAASMAARSRRLILEEVVLLALRCLLVALIVLAMARPFVPSRAWLPWILVLPAALAAAVCAGVAGAVWSDPRRRRQWLRAGAALLAGILAATALEKWLQGQRWWGGGTARDTVIVLDASMSMTLRVDGEANFERALAEARAIINAGSPSDAVGLVLAGAVPRVFQTAPASRREALRLLDGGEFRPLGGSMGILEAMNAGSALLSEGRNPLKRIIIISDGQNVGWDPQNEGRWRYVAESLKSFPAPPQVILHRLPLPRVFNNVALTAISVSRTVVGCDRPVRIEARVSNAGSAPVRPSAVELLVDGAFVERETFVKEIAPGAAESVRFDHQFSSAGRHLVRAQVVCEDDLAADNGMDWVVDVLDRLPVLVVEGAPSRRILDTASGFIRIALSPASEESPRGRPPGTADFLVEPRLISAAELVTTNALEQAKVAILADVPRVPAVVTERLAQFVKNGGGVLIVPGSSAEPGFYGQWTTPAGEPFAPASVGERRAMGTNVAHLVLKTLTHPALRLIADAEHSDAGSVLVNSYWKLQIDVHDPNVRVGGYFDTGDPALVERQLGRGCVLMTAMGLDRRDGNLPSLKCYVPLVHELIYHLASNGMGEGNIRPGMEFAMEWAEDAPNPGAAAGPGYKSPWEVVTPSLRHRAVQWDVVGRRRVVRFGETQEPGLYRLVPTGAAATNLSAGVPFVVAGDPEESSLKALSDTDLALIRGRVDLFLADRAEEVLTVVAGGVPGQELWRYLAVLALLILVGETGLTRWMAVCRRLHTAETVSLRSPAANVQTFRERARQLLQKRSA